MLQSRIHLNRLKRTHQRCCFEPSRNLGRDDLELAFAFAFRQRSQDRLPIPGAPGCGVQDRFFHFNRDQFPGSPPSPLARRVHLRPFIAQPLNGLPLNHHGEDQFAQQVDFRQWRAFLGSHIGAIEQALIPLDHQLDLPAHQVQLKDHISAQFFGRDGCQDQHPLTQEESLLSRRARLARSFAFDTAARTVDLPLIEMMRVNPNRNRLAAFAVAYFQSETQSSLIALSPQGRDQIKGLALAFPQLEIMWRDPHGQMRASLARLNQRRRFTVAAITQRQIAHSQREKCQTLGRMHVGQMQFGNLLRYWVVSQMPAVIRSLGAWATDLRAITDDNSPAFLTGRQINPGQHLAQQRLEPIGTGSQALPDRLIRQLDACADANAGLFAEAQIGEAVEKDQIEQLIRRFDFSSANESFMFARQFGQFRRQLLFQLLILAIKFLWWHLSLLPRWKLFSRDLCHLFSMVYIIILARMGHSPKITVPAPGRSQTFRTSGGKAARIQAKYQPSLHRAAKPQEFRPNISHPYIGRRSRKNSSQISANLTLGGEAARIQANYQPTFDTWRSRKNTS